MISIFLRNNLISNYTLHWYYIIIFLLFIIYNFYFYFFLDTLVLYIFEHCFAHGNSKIFLKKLCSNLSNNIKFKSRFFMLFQWYNYFPYIRCRHMFKNIPLVTAIFHGLNELGQNPKCLFVPWLLFVRDSLFLIKDTNKKRNLELMPPFWPKFCCT